MASRNETSADTGGKYDATISDSMQESLRKALEIFESEQKECASCADSLVRPDVDFASAFGHILITCGTLCVTYGISKPLLSAGTAIIITALLFAAIIVLRRVAICRMLILLYQKYAPERIRNACVFVPSCSQYMLLAIEKYGVCRGVKKGIKRLLRCHPPNGGEDNL